MLIAGREVEGIGLDTAQFAFRDRFPEDSAATVHAAHLAGHSVASVVGSG